MKKDIIDRFVDYLSETEWTDDISTIHSCAMEFKEQYELKHGNPKYLIHHCIHYAMPHEEYDLQKEMEEILATERAKMKERVFQVLLDKVSDSDRKRDFINDVLKEL